ncbi:MAG TPA: hypothetical protein VGN37_29000 [Actinocatenispora sp.]
MTSGMEEQRAALAAARSRLAELTDALSGPAEHTGTDPDGVVMAVVDGAGQVVSVEFAPAVQLLPAEYAGPAVVAALDAAEAARIESITRLVGGEQR